MRSFIVHDVAQKTPEWHQLRVGRLCGSRAAEMLATIKSGGEAAGRRNLRAQLVLERITGKSQEHGFTSAAMQQGEEREAAAFAAYEAMTGQILTRVGFVSDCALMAGVSPDGVIGDFDGIAEIKAPLPATHLDYLKTGKVPGEYLKQIIHTLWITGAQYCDWLSFNPDFPPNLRIKLVRVNRADVDIAAYELAASIFLTEVEHEVEAAKALIEAAA